jgi:hypothetical protein
MARLHEQQNIVWQIGHNLANETDVLLRALLSIALEDAEKKLEALYMEYEQFITLS